VFASRRKLIFVNGCFWHRHSCKRGSRVPKNNQSYWITKIARNVARDRSVSKLLRADGWEIEVVWECELATVCRAALADRLKRFLDGIL
jgi:DNA mismatch endonuclease, patch repair protein